MRGGKQPGAGRPKGMRNKATLAREAILKAYQQRAMEKADPILNAQLTLAQGCSYLYRIDTEIDSNGKKVKSKPVLVTDPIEIQGYLAWSEGSYGAENPNNGSTYYFITTESPDNVAINSILDRTFGKPAQMLGFDPGSGNGKVTIEWGKTSE